MTTERSQLQALHAVTSLNRAVLASASIPIIATNHQGVISLFNTVAEHLLGYAAHELVGKHSPACFHLPEEVEAYARELSAEFWEHIPWVPRVPCPGGQVRKTSANGRMRKDSSKVPVWLCITRCAMKSSRRWATSAWSPT